MGYDFAGRRISNPRSSASRLQHRHGAATAVHADCLPGLQAVRADRLADDRRRTPNSAAGSRGRKRNGAHKRPSRGWSAAAHCSASLPHTAGRRQFRAGVFSHGQELRSTAEAHVNRAFFRLRSRPRLLVHGGGFDTFPSDMEKAADLEEGCWGAEVLRAPFAFRVGAEEIDRKSVV